MNTRPRSITVISWIFIAFGIIALLTSLLSLANGTAAQRTADLNARWMIYIIQMLALLCGVFMLYGFNWARWLLVVWLGYHVILGALHSLFELSVHSLLFAVVLYFLFRSPASTYFRGTRVEPSQIPKDTGEA